jgi:hypothetical protein
VRSIPFDDLRTADLVVDATYEGDRTRKNVSSEPLGPLTGTGNQGGFRFSGPVSRPNLVHRFPISNQIMRQGRACMTKCERRDRD